MITIIYLNNHTTTSNNTTNTTTIMHNSNDHDDHDNGAQGSLLQRGCVSCTAQQVSLQNAL